jgi:hypothetical protein
MNGGLEEVLCRAVDEVSDTLRPWLIPAVHAEVVQQLSGDPTSRPEEPPQRERQSGSGLQLTLTGTGLSPKARTLVALETMCAVEGALRENLQELVQAEIARQRPVSQRVQREFDEWAAASRERAARYSRLATMRENGRKFAARKNGV